MNKQDSLEQLLRSHRSGFSLAQDFYEREDIFQQEYDRFLSCHWIIAGHVSEIPHRGDFFTFEFAGNSLIIVRGEAGKIFALQNVCRHRGARICEGERGHASLLRCRYHGWSYRLDGQIAAWRHMPEGLSKQEFGLLACGVAQFSGIILVSLDPSRAADFSTMTEHISRFFARYELENCKVIARETYRIRANWKLGIENNLECYHCLPSHPEYTAANSFVKADEKLSARHVEQFTSYIETWRARMAQLAVPSGRTDFLAASGQLCRAGTFPLASGQLTGSKDGRGVAPLLGRIAQYDESITTGCFGFLSYVGAMCDYALTITYVPQTVDVTHVVMHILVRKEAEEGKDYSTDAVRWLWDETTKQDKSIIELNARGISTRGYVPGPYSELEKFTCDFVQRYLSLMDNARSCDSASQQGRSE